MMLLLIIFQTLSKNGKQKSQFLFHAQFIACRKRQLFPKWKQLLFVPDLLPHKYFPNVYLSSLYSTLIPLTPNFLCDKNEREEAAHHEKPIFR